MNIKDTFEKKGTWQLVYIMGLYIPVLETISNLVDNVVERIPLAIIGFMMSVAMGLGIYSLVKTKTHVVKSIALIIGFVALSLLSTPLQSYVRSQRYATCDICGFVAVDSGTLECQVCASKTWDDKLMTGYSDKGQYVKEEHLFWFSTESDVEKVNFYLPDGEQNRRGFKKDGSWKPLVTESEVIHYSRKDCRE